MKKMAMLNKDLSKICRLCLCDDMNFIDIFTFSSKLGERIVDAVIKCAPVRIIRHVQLPNSICKMCYRELERVHQFQLQIIQSEKTLQQYLDRLQSDCAPTFFKTSDSVESNLENNRVNTEISNDVKIDWEETKKDHTERNNISSNLDPIIKCEYPENLLETDLRTERLVDIGYNSNRVKKGNHVKTVKPFKTKKKFPKRKNVVQKSPPSVDINQANPIKKPYQCDVCKNSFTRSNSLKQHKLLHTGHKPYRCEICNKRFTNLSNFNTHIQRHTGVKRHQCDVCDKYYTTSSHLNKHKLLHTGEKPLQCDVCYKCFTKRDTYDAHRVQHNENPYQCEVCNKCFTQSVHLKAHKRVHTGEKPFQCDVCSKCFSHGNTLKRHKRVHTGEKPYQCDVCGKCFNQSIHLKTHKRVHTGDNQ